MSLGWYSAFTFHLVCLYDSINRYPLNTGPPPPPLISSLSSEVNLSLLNFLLWGAPAEELYKIAEYLNRWTWAISVSLSKKCVFTVTESHLWFNICLMMESGFTHLTHNTTRSLSLSLSLHHLATLDILLPFSSVWHLCAKALLLCII